MASRTILAFASVAEASMSSALPKSAGIGGMSWDQPGSSWAALAAGFFFSFRGALAMISARWFGIGSEPGVMSMFIIEFALLLTILFETMGPAEHSLQWMLQQPSIRWVLSFLAFSCTSLLWSATVSWPASFLYWSGLASDVAIVVLLLRAHAVSVISFSLMRGFIWGTCVLASIAWMMPATSDLRLGDPEYFNTNQIGSLCAMAILMAQFLAATGDARRRGTIWFLALTLLRSLSKTTIVAFALAQATLMVADHSRSRKRKIATACAAAAVIAVYWGLIGSYVDDYTSGSQAQSLTGRTGIWVYTIGVALDKPWLGNGMDAMWKVFPPFGRDMFEARHAENEILQQFFAYGVVGIVMLAGIYGSLWRRISWLRKGTPKAVLTGVVIFVLIRGLAEAEPFDLLLPLWLTTLISGIVTEAHRECEERRRPPALGSGGLRKALIPEIQNV
jgi:exopolysaccharide production protein ExoQ